MPDIEFRADVRASQLIRYEKKENKRKEKKRKGKEIKIERVLIRVRRFSIISRMSY